MALFVSERSACIALHRKDLSSSLTVGGRYDGRVSLDVLMSREE
jgi:hypothetical protein